MYELAGFIAQRHLAYLFLIDNWEHLRTKLAIFAALIFFIVIIYLFLLHVTCLM